MLPLESRSKGGRQGLQNPSLKAGDTIMYTDQSKFKWATVDKVHPRRERSGHVYADLLFEVGGSGQSLLDSAPAMEDDVLVDGSRKALKGLAVVTDPPALGLRSGLHAAFWTAGEPLARLV